MWRSCHMVFVSLSSAGRGGKGNEGWNNEFRKWHLFFVLGLSVRSGKLTFINRLQVHNTLAAVSLCNVPVVQASCGTNQNYELICETANARSAACLLGKLTGAQFMDAVVLLSHLSLKYVHNLSLFSCWSNEQSQTGGFGLFLLNLNPGDCLCKNNNRQLLYAAWILHSEPLNGLRFLRDTVISQDVWNGCYNNVFAL